MCLDVISDMYHTNLFRNVNALNYLTVSRGLTAESIQQFNIGYGIGESLVKQLRDKLENEISSQIPNSRINGNLLSRLPNTANISFEFVEGEAILLMMDELGICASSGSACTSGSLQPSHVLRAMGVPFTMSHGSIRFSLSIFNTQEEIDFVIEKMPPIIEKLRNMSPYWKTGEKARISL